MATVAGLGTRQWHFILVNRTGRIYGGRVSSAAHHASDVTVVTPAWPAALLFGSVQPAIRRLAMRVVTGSYAASASATYGLPSPVPSGRSPPAVELISPT
ncbi:hypothetical protein HC031_16825 [Planosporangium thailandense]|uniref:Uncharacterized protein n=1 Tax=Planosporangium thailandense TaxID=765197 RepID=A0ABX0Y1M3_9ACTN|nr:hypothetical protein [Planosporangium thailandense]NJC71367.1 hypothetical protein [Planosporangium thailandense]